MNLLEEWEQLGGLLSDVYLSEGRDEVSLSLERSHKYTTRSLYRLMTSRGVVDYQMMVIWKTNIPLKVKIFMWMAVHDRIQCSVQLKKKQWSGPEECFACGNLETSNHILFQCPHCCISLVLLVRLPGLGFITNQLCIFLSRGRGEM